MRSQMLVVGILIFACNAASAQKTDPDDGYWGPRDTSNQADTFNQRWSGNPLAARPRFHSEGRGIDRPAPPETTGRSEPPKPNNSPDPHPLPGEEPRPIPR
jgi:hypothetical protein